VTKFVIIIHTNLDTLKAARAIAIARARARANIDFIAKVKMSL
jgi:hypothetical protein